MALRVAVVGVGRFGQHHARVYSQLKDVKLVGVVDPSQARAEEIAAKFGAKAYPDYRDVLDMVDAVSIVVPTVAHHEVGRAFLDRGIPTLIEKPLAKKIEEAEDLVRVAKTRNTVLQVGHIERFNPAFQIVQERIRRPRFVESYRVSPFPYRSVDIDVVLDVMIHDIDIILHVVKSELKRVDAIGVALLFKHEDMANARLEFEDGCVANVTASRVATTTTRKLKVYSEDAYIGIDFKDKTARVLRMSDGLKAALKQVDRSSPVPKDEDLRKIPQDLYAVEELKMEQPREPLEEELESFVQAAQGKRPPVVSGEHGLRAMKVANAVLKEIRDHHWA